MTSRNQALGRAIQADWDNREVSDTLKLSIQRVHEFVANFGAFLRSLVLNCQDFDVAESYCFWRGALIAHLKIYTCACSGHPYSFLASTHSQIYG